MNTEDKASIYYRDIGDYLSREEKLRIVSETRSFLSPNFAGLQIHPNESGDWISQRNDKFSEFIPLAPEKKFDVKTQSFFVTVAIGVATNRDAWVYNFSKTQIQKNMSAMIDFYNEQRTEFQIKKAENPDIHIEDFINSDTTKISWTVNLKKLLERGVKLMLDKEYILYGLYRPFCVQRVYFDENTIERPGLSKKLFPTPSHKNLLICVHGLGGNKPFSTLITQNIPDLNSLEAGAQCFPLYYYEERKIEQNTLFDETAQDSHIRHDGISDFILKHARDKYGSKVTKEDLFYYVYGILHVPSYRELFAADLKKMLPKLPLVGNTLYFWQLCEAGRKLAELHLNYETVPPFEGVRVTGEETGNFTVRQMKFPSKGQKDTILYNSAITISNIPAKAYEYVINGKSAIEWIMERYALTTHKESGIQNDPNDWAAEHEKPRYMLDLLLSVINVSMQTVDLVQSLPVIDWEKE